jgi:hypothetical protein
VRDPFGRISSELAVLLEEERIPLPTPSEAKAKLRARLQEAMNNPPPEARTAPRPPPRPTLRAAPPVAGSNPFVRRRETWSWTVAGLVALAFLAGALIGAAIQARLDKPDPKDEARAARARAAQAVPRRKPSKPEAISELPAAAAFPPNAIEAPPTPLQIEKALLERAKLALANGQVADARTALDAHLDEFPGGQLAEDRAVQALAAEGRHEESRERAKAFRVQYPKSPLLAPPPAAVPSALSH